MACGTTGAGTVGNGKGRNPQTSGTQMTEGYKIRIGWLNPHEIVNLTISDDPKRRNEKFYRPLVDHARVHGIRNAILVEAGRCRKGHVTKLTGEQKEKEEHLFFTTQLGGTRLAAAKELDIPIKCIISDFQNLCPNFPEITVEQALEHMPDLQKGTLRETREGLSGPTLKHVHMQPWTTEEEDNK